MNAPVAQGIEQGLPKPRVGGSIPPRRTYKLFLIDTQDGRLTNIYLSNTSFGYGQLTEELWMKMNHVWIVNPLSYSSTFI